MELLVKKAQKGDEEAFIKVIDEYMTQMYKIARSRIKGEESIGDVIQETIIAAFTNIKKLREPSYFKTWLIKILINKCNDIIKDNKVLYVDDYSSLENINLIYSENPEERLDFESILDKLNNDYRLVVVMYYVNRFTTKEISEILNEKEGTIKSRLSRAREQLKTHYLREKCIAGGIK
jgi:RNA polymerase sigma-70 factor (ECF subfamily)